MRGVRCVDHPGGVLQGSQLHADKLLGAFSDEALAEHDSAQIGDRIEQRSGPLMFHQDQGEARTGDERLRQGLGSLALENMDTAALERGEHVGGVELGVGDQQVAEVLVGDLDARE